jgi:hypothetical protein
VARGWVKSYPFTVGEFVRDYLAARGRAHVHEVWRAFRETLKAYGRGWWGSYDSFRKHFHLLARLGLVKRVGSGPPANPNLVAFRQYYELNPRRAGVEEAWRRPKQVLYPEAIYGARRKRAKEEEAKELGVTLRELALQEYPELREARRALGLE